MDDAKNIAEKHVFGNSGFGKYTETEVAKTLRSSGGDIGGGQAGQGYPCVLAAIEGNGSRPSHKGIGINDGKVMYTLNGTEVHGVICSNEKQD